MCKSRLHKRTHTRVDAHSNWKIEKGLEMKPSSAQARNDQCMHMYLCGVCVFEKDPASPCDAHSLYVFTTLNSLHSMRHHNRAFRSLYPLYYVNCIVSRSSRDLTSTSRVTWGKKLCVCVCVEYRATHGSNGKHTHTESRSPVSAASSLQNLNPTRVVNGKRGLSPDPEHSVSGAVRETVCVCME